MADDRIVLLCSCEDTMPLADGTVRKACRGAEVKTARALCRAELDRFRDAAATGRPVTVACTQEAPLFAETAAEAAERMLFANIRETAGWSDDAAAAGQKMAALIAAAAEPLPATPYLALSSEGVILVHGTIRSAQGHLGAFELAVDDYATPAPSSRGALAFGPARDNATSRCDIVLDLAGGTPLFPAPDLRDGYLRADPADPAAVLRAVLKARDLVGTFDKPRYVTFTEHLCAHSRSRIVGCSRCLDLCPTGAIAPAGDHVAIDAAVCAGCGQCAAVCPTGAASYALPPADTLMRKLRTLLTVYREAGGAAPVLLMHDDEHGGALIDALARHGDGLPANVLPLAVNEVTQVGIETVAAAFAYGAGALRLLLRARPHHDVAGLVRTVALAEPILVGLGFGEGRVATIETDDPDALGETLRAIAPALPCPRPASFAPVGAKRDVMRLALRELQRAAPAPVDVVALPAGAAVGAGWKD